VNPFKILTLKQSFYKIVKEVKPDTVFTFQLKPNVFGTLAAKKAGVEKIFSMVEGLGDTFIRTGLKWSIIRKAVCCFYKHSLKRAQKVFFLNHDDKEEFLRRSLIKESQCEVIKGIGVDLEHFAFSEIKNFNTFLMTARMLETKGVYEYCKCARLVKKSRPNAVFNYLGAEGTVTVADIKQYIDDGSINYLGTAKDVRPVLEESAVFVLPSSYREGLPMSIMEAQSMGRGVITTRNVGCRDTVEDGVNGFLIEKYDYNALAEKCIWFVDNPHKVVEMGKNARDYAEKEFDSRLINAKICEVMGI
jgi:glycosyltransferase involved in cell wall biosynthesis